MQGKIMSKQDFLHGSSYAKEEYEGLIVSADAQMGGYNIGVQLDENTVLVVDHAKGTDADVHKRLENWVPKIADIQRQFNAHPDSQNYVR